MVKRIKHGVRKMQSPFTAPNLRCIEFSTRNNIIINTRTAGMTQYGGTFASRCEKGSLTMTVACNASHASQASLNLCSRPHRRDLASLPTTTEQHAAPLSVTHGLCLSTTAYSAQLVGHSKAKTYNRRDSQMVTHSSTSRPVQCLCMAERTGCPVFTDLWSYVLVLFCANNISRAVYETLISLQLLLSPFRCPCPYSYRQA